MVKPKRSYPLTFCDLVVKQLHDVLFAAIFIVDSKGTKNTCEQYTLARLDIRPIFHISLQKWSAFSYHLSVLTHKIFFVMHGHQLKSAQVSEYKRSSVKSWFGHGEHGEGGNRRHDRSQYLGRATIRCSPG